MLSFVLRDASGNEMIMPPAVETVIKMEEDVPADELRAVFPYNETGEAATVSAYDGNRLVFFGDVDEEERSASIKGEYLSIIARSAAARLLDNEARPCCYDHPSARLIYERHVKGYGIAEGDVDDSTYFGELNVMKGDSQWKVLENFCAACYAGTPRVSADGRLYMRGLADSGEAIFSDAGDGIPYRYIRESVRRCEELSRVNVKIDPAGGYDYKVDNCGALKRGVCRERYLNAALASTPIKRADVMIEKSRERAYELTLVCPSMQTDALGKSARVKSRILGGRDGLYVSAVKYRLDSKGEATIIKLKRRYS